MSLAQSLRTTPSSPFSILVLILVPILAVLPAPTAAGQSVPDPAPPDPAARLLTTLEPPLQDLVTEVLERNPDVARSRAAAVAAELRAPQVRALPDPMASLTAFLLTPETRVGPQQAAISLSQRLPWFGKLALREQEALYRAAAASAEVEARRLALVTETRRLVYDLGFLAAQEEALRADRATLVHYEELARARYASGVGLQQAVVRIQAEITKDDNRQLDLETRRATLLAALNALRDRPADTAVPELPLPALPPLPELAPETLSGLAREARPEIARARALIEAARVASELADKEKRPDVTLGLGYTLVGRREDAAGRASPPQGNGDEVLGVTVGVNLPIWRQRIAAGVAEAAARESGAEDELRGVAAGIDQALGELVERIPLTRRQLSLFDDLLVVQAQEALSSAEAAYAAGSLGSLDLLDAERVLLEVRIASARTLADYLTALARLEGATGVPAAELSRRSAP